MPEELAEEACGSNLTLKLEKLFAYRRGELAIPARHTPDNALKNIAKMIAHLGLVKIHHFY